MNRTLPVILTAVACTGADPLPEELACDEAGDAEQTVTASPSEIEAPGLLFDDPTWVALDDAAATFLAIESGGEPLLLFVGTEGVVTGLRSETGDATLPTPSPLADCPEDVPEHYDLDLAAGSWRVVLAPSALGEVWMMLSLAGEHEDE